jgi:hypothetical protein
MLTGLGYAAEAYAQLSPVTARVNNDAALSWPARVCKRVVMLQDVDVECSDDEERDYDDDNEPRIVGPPSRRKNTPVSYASMHASCRRSKDKATKNREELDKVQKQHMIAVTTNLTLSNNLQLAELAHSELQMINKE